MHRNASVFTILIACFGLALVAGCSSDSNELGGGLQLGDPDDQGYQFVEEMVGEGLMTSFKQSLGVSLALADSLPGMGGVSRRGLPSSLNGLTDNVVISSIDSIVIGGDWFVFWFDATIAEGFDTVMLVGVDSIQWQENGDAVDPRQSDSLDGVLARAHLAIATNQGMSAAFHHRLDLAVEAGGIDSLVTIDGTLSDSVGMAFEDTTASCDIALANNVLISNITIVNDATDNSCPENGSIVNSADIDLSCSGQGDDFEQLDVDGNWTVTLTANGDGSVTITYTDGTSVWTAVTDDCSGEDDVVVSSS